MVPLLRAILRLLKEGKSKDDEILKDLLEIDNAARVRL